jgi:hypothetical protein
MKQLMLNLPEKDDRRQKVYWHYDFSKKTMVERIGECTYTYGSWDFLFGCWITPNKNARSKEIIPNWRLMNENGSWNDSDRCFGRRFRNIDRNIGHNRSLKWRRHERAAFMAFLSTIPRPIRTLVSPFRSYTWLLLDMIWQVPEFAKFLDQEIRQNSGQYIVSILAHSNAAWFARAKRYELAKRIMSEKRGDLLREISSISSPKRYLKVVAKMGDQYVDALNYMELASVMESPTKARLISHENNPSWNIVNVLRKIPDELATHNLVGMAVRNRDLGSLKNLIDLLGVLRDAEKLSIIGSLRSAKSPDAAKKLVDKWYLHILKIVTFPEAPLRPHKYLVPLDSSDAMQREAREMNNCVMDLIDDVFNDFCFFYHWCGPEPATIRIWQDPEFGDGSWRLKDAAGVNNDELSDQSVNYLISLVRNLSPIDISNPEITISNPTIDEVLEQVGENKISIKNSFPVGVKK